jgi:hypothetical protein
MSIPFAASLKTSEYLELRGCCEQLSSGRVAWASLRGSLFAESCSVIKELLEKMIGRSKKNFIGTRLLKGVRLSACAPLLFLGACASIAQGTMQEVEVRSKPDGAQCQISQQGAQVASVSTTPGIATVSREGNDLQITCKKEAYNDAEATSSYHAMSPAFWYNFYWLLPIITFPVTIVGVIVDLSTGAYHYYDSPIELTLTPAEGTAAAAPK